MKTFKFVFNMALCILCATFTGAVNSNERWHKLSTSLTLLEYAECTKNINFPIHITNTKAQAIELV